MSDLSFRRRQIARTKAAPHRTERISARMLRRFLLVVLGALFTGIVAGMIRPVAMLTHGGLLSKNGERRSIGSEKRPSSVETGPIIDRLKASVRQRQAQLLATPESIGRLRLALLRLEQHSELEEPRPKSPRPLLGRLIVGVRRFVYQTVLKWYLRPLVEGEIRFRREALALLGDLVEERAEVERRLLQMETYRWTAEHEGDQRADDEA